MNSLSGRLNFSQHKTENENEIKIDKRKDINYFETLCLYCSDNDIDLSNIKDSDFSSASIIMEDHGKQDKYQDHYYFSIDV